MRGTVGQSTSLCHATYWGGIKLSHRPSNRIRLPLSTEGKKELSQVLGIQAMHRATSERYRPTVPFVSILKDARPSPFYVMQEEG